jgi:hypothetical protein
MEDRLASVGIHCISPDWLSACKEYLQQHNQQPTSSSSEDEILEQIINTDLRNVVRRFDAALVGTSIQYSLPSITLRNAMKISSNPNQGICKATLPQTFKLVVQIEELLDVSLNAEGRLALGPASSSSPTPIGNQKKRCLKILISDGYFPNGDCRRLVEEGNGNSSGSGSDQCHIVAMETVPIPSLSVHSKPGIKIVLCGPIEIRFGILMLNPGNTTVLGGCIPELIPIQKKAMNMAAKLAGIGIDPTFRALVWNPDSGMEEDEDEGEGESGDLPVRPVAPANAGAAVQPPPLVDANHSRPHRVHARITQGTAAVVNPSDGTRRPLVDSTTNANPQSLTTTGKSVSNPYQRSQLHEPVQQQHQRQQVHSDLRQQSITSNVQNSTNVTTSNNPYSRQQVVAPSTRSTSGSANSSTSSNTGALHNPYAAGNPYTRIQANDSNRSKPNTAKTPTAAAEAIDLTSPDSLDADISNISQMSIQSKTQSRSQLPVSSNPYTKNQSSESTSKAPCTTPKRNASAASTAFQSHLSPTALSEPMSFMELNILMERIVSDPSEYKLYEKKSFIVPCKYPAKKKNEFMGFKIEKQKDYKLRGVGKVSVCYLIRAHLGMFAIEFVCTLVYSQYT